MLLSELGVESPAHRRWPLLPMGPRRYLRIHPIPDKEEIIANVQVVPVKRVVWIFGRGRNNRKNASALIVAPEPACIARDLNTEIQRHAALPFGSSRSSPRAATGRQAALKP